MAIEVVCPNGHVLRVKDKHAGSMGLCPKCQTRVMVPKLEAPVVPATPQPQPQVAGKGLSDADVMGLLGGEDDALAVHQEAKHRDTSRISDSTIAGSSSLLSSSSILKIPKKTCKRCGRDVPGQFSICPHCRTFMGDLQDRSRSQVEPCKRCGTMPMPNDVFCVSCGTDLRLG